MAKLTKEKSISILFDCVKKYDAALNNHSLLFICTNKHKETKAIEVTFDKSNFLHLTGCKTKIAAIDFYDRCMDQRLSIDDFQFATDGTTEMKMRILPFMLKKDLSANSIGDYNGSKPKLKTDKLAGGIRGCMGFTKTGTRSRFVPNTLLEEDIRDLTRDNLRIIVTYRKKISDERYHEIVHVAKKVDWDKITYPTEFAYLTKPDIITIKKATDLSPVDAK